MVFLLKLFSNGSAMIVINFTLFPDCGVLRCVAGGSIQCGMEVSRVPLGEAPPPPPFVGDLAPNTNFSFQRAPKVDVVVPR